MSNPLFATIEEYEKYLDALHEMIAARIEQYDDKLNTIEQFIKNSCENCSNRLIIPNRKFYSADGSKKAYTDCLTFFTYATLKTKRDINIHNKILKGDL